jgi:hypothetical protein
MNAVARLNFDRQYYKMMYSEWLKYRSHYRKFAVPIALGLAGLGLAVAAWLSSPLLAVLTLIVAAADLIEIGTHRKRWLRKVLNLSADKRAELTFTDSEIQFKSDNSHGAVRYETWRTAIATPNSVFLIPSAGASIFIPLSTIEPASAVETLVAIVLTKVNRRGGANYHVA